MKPLYKYNKKKKEKKKTPLRPPPSSFLRSGGNARSPSPPPGAHDYAIQKDPCRHNSRMRALWGETASGGGGEEADKTALIALIGNNKNSPSALTHQRT